jgi:hypothetical protein
MGPRDFEALVFFYLRIIETSTKPLFLRAKHHAESAPHCNFRVMGYWQNGASNNSQKSNTYSS